MNDSKPLNTLLTPDERRQILISLGVNIVNDRMQVNDLKNPAYNDEIGSMSINLRNGLVRDFGDESYTGDLVNYVQKRLNCDFIKAKEYIGKCINKSLEDPDRLFVKDYTPEPKKDPFFWDKHNMTEFLKCRKKLDELPDDLIGSIDRDCISIDTLKKYKCGYYSYPDFQFGKTKANHGYIFDFLMFPIATGSQLYRRESGTKVCRNVKGSYASDSMFGYDKTMEKQNVLFIMKSPREVMCFSQYQTQFNILGLCSGEDTGDNLSDIVVKQIENLLKEGDCVINVFLDCDKAESYENAYKYCKKLGLYFGSKAMIYLCNIFQNSKGLFKDFTDIAIESCDKGHDVREGKMDDELGSIVAKTVTNAELIT